MISSVKETFRCEVAAVVLLMTVVAAINISASTTRSSETLQHLRLFTDCIKTECQAQKL